MRSSALHRLGLFRCSRRRRSRSRLEVGRGGEGGWEMGRLHVSATVAAYRGLGGRLIIRDLFDPGSAREGRASRESRESCVSCV